MPPLERTKNDRPWRPVKAEPWRVICSCQSHGAANHGLRSLASKVEPLRSPYAVLLFGVPIVLGAVALPGNDAAITARTVTPVKPLASVVSIVPRTHFTQPLFGSDELRLNLITPKIRRDFMKGNSPDRLSLELVTAEFFRTEVPYGSIIYREARRHGLSPELVAAVVEAESDFRPRLLSHKQAHGLMQLIPSTGQLMGVNDLMNPAENVRGGTRYLKYLHHRFDGDQTMILAAYNAGEGTVRRFGGVPPYAETRNYLVRVEKSRARYETRVAKRMAELSALLNSANSE